MVAHLFVRQRRQRPLARVAAHLAIEAVDRLGVLVLQARVALVEQQERLHEFGRLLHHPGQLRGGHGRGAQRPILERAIELAQHALVGLVGELRHVAAEGLGQAQQHRGRHRSLVALDLAHVAERQREAFGQRGLAQAVLLAQAPDARSDEQFPGGLPLSGHASQPFLFHKSLVKIFANIPFHINELSQFVKRVDRFSVNHPALSTPGCRLPEDWRLHR